MKNQKSYIRQAQHAKIKNQKGKLKIRYFLFLICIFTFSSLIFNLLSVTDVHAQISSIGIANYLEIAQGKMEEGDIIVSSEKGYALSSVAYDTKIVGVVTLSPAISLKTAGTKRGFPVVSQGGAVVKVTDAGGNIKMGDFITTSETPGTGMKAVENGYVLGEAGENVNFKKKGEIKLIKVSINPRSMSSSTRLNNPLLDVFKIGSLAASDKPGKVLQYVVASLIILVTFGCGFFIFAKTVITGLEAIGRNPLAGRMIQVSIVFNIIMIIVVIIAGTGLAYLVIRL